MLDALPVQTRDPLGNLVMPGVIEIPRTLPDDECYCGEPADPNYITLQVMREGGDSRHAPAPYVVVSGPNRICRRCAVRHALPDWGFGVLVIRLA